MLRKGYSLARYLANRFQFPSSFFATLGLIVASMAGVLFLPPSLHAQSSPLTVQPSTGRVGIGNTNPGYPLDVTGTVNATAFRGDGAQLTNLPVTGGSTILNKVTANSTVTGTTKLLFTRSRFLAILFLPEEKGDKSNILLRFPPWSPTRVES